MHPHVYADGTICFSLPGCGKTSMFRFVQMMKAMAAARALEKEEAWERETQRYRTSLHAPQHHTDDEVFGEPIYLFNHIHSTNTGKRSMHTPVASVARCATPQVIGSGGGGDGGGGGGGGDDGGGEDGDSGDGEPPTRRLWHLIKSLLLYLFLGITWPYRALPDLVMLMRRFEDVFPSEIHQKLYAPEKYRLLREICCARDAEWEQPRACVAWKWVWRRVRFWYLVATCFRKWACEAVPRWLRRLIDG